MCLHDYFFLLWCLRRVELELLRPEELLRLEPRLLEEEEDFLTAMYPPRMVLVLFFLPPYRIRRREPPL
jgi:hypothetical protein